MLLGTETLRSAERFPKFADFFADAEKSVNTMEWALEQRPSGFRRELGVQDLEGPFFHFRPAREFVVEAARGREHVR